jgi:hypothetical protein
MMINVTSKTTKLGWQAKLSEGTHLFLQTNNVLLLWLEIHVKIRIKNQLKNIVWSWQDYQQSKA